MYCMAFAPAVLKFAPKVMDLRLSQPENMEAIVPSVIPLVSNVLRSSEVSDLQFSNMLAVCIAFLVTRYSSPSMVVSFSIPAKKPYKSVISSYFPKDALKETFLIFPSVSTSFHHSG